MELPEHIVERIRQAIGEASTCWSNLEEAGVFETEQASKIASNLCKFLEVEMETIIATELEKREKRQHD